MDIFMLRGRAYWILKIEFLDKCNTSFFKKNEQKLYDWKKKTTFHWGMSFSSRVDVQESARAQSDLQVPDVETTRAKQSSRLVSNLETEYWFSN